jgi:UDP-N-acetylmuramate--alanine ligase
VVVFQPHRFSRTQDLFDDFSRVLSGADLVVLTEVYAAGEAPIDGVDSRALCQSIRARGQVDPVLVPGVEDIIPTLENLVLDGDLVLLMGAGSIESVAQELRDRPVDAGDKP